MKRILIVTYAFPPDRSSQAQHVWGIWNALSQNYEVDCLTVKRQETISNDTKIHYAQIGKLHQINEKKSSESKTKIIRKNNFAKKLKRYLIPDTVIDWYPKAVKYFVGNMYKEYDVIIGIATPYTDILIANKLSKLMKKSKLILVYADPWYGEKSVKKNKLRRKLEYNIENKLLMNSDAIFMVTKNAMEYYKKIFPVVNHKIDYYYMGHNFPVDRERKEYKRRNSIVIRYFGSIQSVHRDPYIFLRALNNKKYLGLIKVELYLLPHVSHNDLILEIESSEVLSKIVNLKSSISYQDMIKKIDSSNYTLMFGNSSKLQIPGKLYDYIGLKSNIIYIKNEENTEIESLLSEYNASYIVDNSAEEISKLFDKLCAYKDEKTVNLELCQNLFRTNSCMKLEEKVKELMKC